MRYIIMADGEGKRWHNYLDLPKHLVEIGGEPIIGRTVRLLKENGITDIIITARDERYNFADRQPQSDRDCEIDRFDEKVIEECNEICYLYGDVYYSEEAIKMIINTPVDDCLFFGSTAEIFAIKIMNIPFFMEHKHRVKKLFMEGEIDRYIGWEIYRSIHSIPFNQHIITDRYKKILDGTDDIDYPEDYERFKQKVERLSDLNTKLKVSLIVPCYNEQDRVTKALDSIPVRDDLEIIAINDGSTDDTLMTLTMYKENHPERNMRIIDVQPNQGLGNAKNVGYDNAKGEYVNQLDADDWLYTDKYNKVIDQLDGTDMVYMNLIKNDGSIFDITSESQRGLCSGCARFIKREFLGDTRCPKVQGGEDWFLNEALQPKPHTDKFTRINAYHYNFPREGSLYDRMLKGEIRNEE